MAQIIPVVTEQKSPLELHVERQLTAVNQELQRRVMNHRMSYNHFWNSPHKPADQLALMGPKAGLWLASARQSVLHIAALVEVANLGRPSDQQLTLNDVLSPEFYEPRLQFAVAQDGTVTLVAEEGKDEWGRPLPE